MFRKLILILIITAIAAGACRKVVFPELQNGKTLLVIEGNIDTDNKPWLIKLTLTQDYFDNNPPPYVTDAFVTISDDQATVDTLFYTNEGIYSTKTGRQSVIGKTYTLTVNYDNRKYTATEKCLAQEKVDSLTYEFKQQKFPFKEGYYISQHGLEKPGVGDYYLWDIYQNYILKSDYGYFLNDDALVDGQYLHFTFPFAFEKSDTVTINQYAISKNYYNYLLDVEAQASRSGSPFDTPAVNPISNITGNALGYFSVRSKISNEIVIK
jgi:hypothetical protein